MSWFSQLPHNYTYTCQSICLLRSKPREQEPEETPRPWICCVCERKPNLRFISRVYLCGKAKAKGPCVVLQSTRALQFCFAEQQPSLLWEGGEQGLFLDHPFLLVVLMVRTDSGDVRLFPLLCSPFHKAPCFRPSELLKIRGWMRGCGLHQSYGIHSNWGKCSFTAATQFQMQNTNLVFWSCTGNTAILDPLFFHVLLTTTQSICWNLAGESMFFQRAQIMSLQPCYCCTV